MKNIRYISASAGTGKTYTLTHHVANLIKSGYSPRDFILTTFTEAAAAELRERVRAVLHEMGLHDQAALISDALIGTVHSVYRRLSDRYWDRLGLSPVMNVIDEADAAIFLDESLANLPTSAELRKLTGFYRRYRQTKRTDSGPVPNPDYWKDWLKAIIDKMKAYGITDTARSRQESEKLIRSIFMPVPDLATTEERKRCRDMVDVMKLVFALAERWREEYAEYKRKRHLTDYSDMESRCLELLEQPDVRAALSERYKVLMVDEFQDSNPIQLRIFSRLSDCMEHTLWVGDPKQAIYGFRGSDHELTYAAGELANSKHYDAYTGVDASSLPAEEVLYQCRRSVKDLITVFNTVFANLFHSAAGVTIPARVSHWHERVAEPGRPSLVHLVHTGAEGKASAQLVAAYVRSLIEGPQPRFQPDQIALLYPTRSTEYKEVGRLLREAGIPVSAQSASLDEQAEVALMLAVLASIDDGGDALAKTQIAHLTDERWSLAEILRRRAMHRTKSAEEALWMAEIPLVKAAKAHADELRPLSVSAMARAAYRELGVRNVLLRWGSASRREANITTFFALAEAYEQYCAMTRRPGTVRGFINYFRRRVSVGGSNDKLTKCAGDPKGVTLTTYHGSKGLEWDCVLLRGLGSTEATQDGKIKSDFYGVNKRRAASPSAEELFPEVVITLIPDAATQKDAPSTFAAGVAQSEFYGEIVAGRIAERCRLMYVAMTRARDTLVTGSAGNGRFGALEELGIRANVNTALPAMDIFNCGIESVIVRPVAASAPAPAPARGVVKGLKEGEPCVAKPWRVAPSELPEDMEPCAVGHAYSTGHRISLGANPDMAAVGSCIHDIFASLAFNPLQMEQIAEAYGVAVALPDLRGVPRAWDDLTGYLRENFGEAVAVAHELPFMRELDGGQMASGSMDLVWQTAEGCVLVDFKTYPGGASHALDPKDPHYAGRYGSQLRHYAEALEEAGLRVLATLIFYPVSGTIVPLLLKEGAR